VVFHLRGYVGICYKMPKFSAKIGRYALNCLPS
jgi:hypothetical protein